MGDVKLVDSVRGSCLRGVPVEKVRAESLRGSTFINKFAGRGSSILTDSILTAGEVVSMEISVVGFTSEEPILSSRRAFFRSLIAAENNFIVTHKER